MFWFFVLGLSGTAALGVAAWARRSRKRADDQAETRRSKNQLDIQERELLAKLRSQQGGPEEGEG